MANPTPRKNPLRYGKAPDGSYITQSMSKANDALHADIRAGNVSPSGVVLKDRNGAAMNNPIPVGPHTDHSNHTTTALPAAPLDPYDTAVKNFVKADLQHGNDVGSLAIKQLKGMRR